MMLGVTLLDRRRNSWLYEKLKLREVRSEAVKRKWLFAKKIATGEDTWAKKIVEWRPWEKTRGVGRPKPRWRDDLRAVLVVGDLVSTLLNGYDKRSSPYNIRQETVIVNLTIPFMVLLAVKENDREADWLYSYTMLWYDERLRFNATEYNQTSVFIPDNELWVPPFFAYNTIEVKPAFGDFEAVEVNSNGLLQLRKTVYASLVCEVDVPRFPFDTQYCVIAFSSPAVPIEHCDMAPFIDRTTYLGGISGNSEFKYFNQTLASNNYSIAGQNYRAVIFIAHLKRYPTYYIVMVVIPTFFICVVTITGALVPLRQGESNDIVGLGLGSILALIFMLSIVADKLPKTPGLAWLGAEARDQRRPAERPKRSFSISLASLQK
ncbi:unnamed protein product [Caenorhabditis auriculariae]|uniref:Neurotransmitter-gated ion-channel ligand-binding domain-containing protein n=1 Tax=Caenorhabditis auriculariae TaxID=2777116 RepID=A0A8S1HVI5_9PELO|nr:unnamed protein product [Caenorhabditis auriculariae]